MEKLYKKTPIGRIEIPSWEVKKLINLTDEELLTKAILENKNFCISPATFSMIEKRGLVRSLQYCINPEIGQNHATLKMTNNW
jgi:hypothetical protein